MKYKELNEKIRSGEIELHVLAEKQFKKFSPETDEATIDRFLLRNHIKIKEMPEDEKAYIEYNSVYASLLSLATQTKSGDLFSLANDMLTGMSYSLTEGEKNEMMALETRLAELKPLASKWAKFTGGKLRDWNNWF